MTKDEETALRELAAGRCTIQKVVDAIGPLSLWSKDGLDREIRMAVEAERERIKAANAPEIERINAHIKELEDAVLAEREACAKVCEEYANDSRTGATCADAIRARGQA
jgi:hypothetical protein